MGSRSGRHRTLRRRILTATLTVTAVATVAFGVPLGIVLTRMERERAVLRLEREASEVLARIPDEQLSGAQPFILPEPLSDDRESDPMAIAVYDTAGRLLSGAGPATSALAREATQRSAEVSGTEQGQLAVAEPLRTDRPSQAAIRVAVRAGKVTEELQESLALMAGLAVLVLLVAGAVAFALARRLSRPLESLAATAQRLGDGDFTVRADRSQTAEIDDVGHALDATAHRLGSLVERERAFTADASHQIRTPLTALRLMLESAPMTPGADLAEVVSNAVLELDRLEETVRHLLAVARDTEQPGMLLDVSALVGEIAARWQPAFAHAGRALVVELADSLPAVRASHTGLSHVFDVLLDNALGHGAGTVTAVGRAVGTGVAIDVHDEGPGVTVPTAELFRRRGDFARGHGIGLALARSLVEADGGRLELSESGPGATFTILLPGAHGEAFAEAVPPQTEFR